MFPAKVIHAFHCVPRSLSSQQPALARRVPQHREKLVAFRPPPAERCASRSCSWGTAFRDRPRSSDAVGGSDCQSVDDLPLKPLANLTFLPRWRTVSGKCPARRVICPCSLRAERPSPEAPKCSKMRPPFVRVPRVARALTVTVPKTHRRVAARARLMMPATCRRNQTPVLRTGAVAIWSRLSWSRSAGRPW